MKNMKYPVSPKLFDFVLKCKPMPKDFHLPAGIFKGIPPPPKEPK